MDARERAEAAILAALAELRAGRITERAFVTAARQALARLVTPAYLAGKGGRSLTGPDIDRIESLLNAREQRLVIWASEAAAGAQSPTADAHRASMYTESARSAVQVGALAALFSQGSPFDWELGATDTHCENCVAAASGGPYTVATLPGVPGYGFCDGGDHCGCRLVAH